MVTKRRLGVLPQRSTDPWNNFKDLIRTACKTHNYCEYHRRALGLLRAKQWDSLVDYADSLAQQTYASPGEHYRANQLAALIRKYPFPTGKVSYDPQRTAESKFNASETKCEYWNSYLNAPLGVHEADFQAMRSFIRFVLGEGPDLQEIYSQCGFGPGAAIGVHGNATHLGRKATVASITCTPGAYHYARAAYMSHAQLREITFPDVWRNGIVCYSETSLERVQSIWRSRVQVVSYNKIAFVPKTAKTMRSIAVEPLANAYLQKGADLAIRLRLKRIGIDLRDQTINQRMAREGALRYQEEDSFVTIDLSAASDSISRTLVRQLLPYEWHRFLDAIRSPNRRLPNGDTLPYSKFCSMGNGFCFPLETLIFTAAVIAAGGGVAGQDFHVYGDDIVVRKSVSEKLIQLLFVMGFDINPEKTFTSGPFRESCGEDYFIAYPVRGVTMDFELSSLEKFIILWNLSLRNELSRAYFAFLFEFIVNKVGPHNLLLRPREGTMNGAMTVEMDVFLSLSVYARFHRHQRTWEWKELVTVPIVDDDWTLRTGRESHWYAVLAGAAPGNFGAVSGLPLFSKRHQTRTTYRKVR